MPDQRLTPSPVQKDQDRNHSDRWDELDAANPPHEDSEKPRRGFWERLGMLFNLHPRGPQGG